MNRFDQLEKEVASLKKTVEWITGQLRSREPQGLTAAEDGPYLIVQLGGFGKPRRVFRVVAQEESG